MLETPVEAAAAPARDRASTGPGRLIAALGLLSLSIAISVAVRTAFSPMQELAQQELKLTDLQMSLIQGVAASIPVAVLAIPVGRLIDRTHRIRLLIVMSVIWSLGAVWTAFAPGFWSLFFARMLAGLGSICAVPIAVSLAADLTSAKARGRAMLPLTLGNWIGAAAAFAAGGAVFGALKAHPPAWMGSLSAWRGVELVFGLASLALTLPLFLVREPARQEVVEAGLGFRDAMAGVWRRVGFLGPLFVGQVAVVMADVAATIWAAPVLSRVFKLQPSEFAGWMGGVVLLSGVGGAVIGGLTADLGQKARLRGGLLVGAVILSAAAIPASLFPIAPSMTAFAWTLGAFLLCGSAAGIITATAIAVYVPNELRGVCLGAFVVVGGVIGFGVAPSLVALCSDALGGASKLAPALAIVGVGTGITSFLGFVLAMIKAPKAST